MTEKGKGLLAWLLSLIGASIVLFGMKDASKNTKLHAAQSLVLSACYILVTIILSIVVSAMSWRTLLYGGYTVVSVIRGIAGLIYGVFGIWGIVKVCQDADAELPVLGKIAKSIFGKKIDEEPIPYAQAAGTVQPQQPVQQPMQQQPVQQAPVQPQQPVQTQVPPVQNNTQVPPTQSNM